MTVIIGTVKAGRLKRIYGLAYRQRHGEKIDVESELEYVRRGRGQKISVYIRLGDKLDFERTLKLLFTESINLCDDNFLLNTGH
jgi:hypothetical protein